MESDAVSVDIWSMDLGLCSSLAEVGDILSPEEISRARRLPSDVRRRRYIVCHIALRIILSDYAEIESRNLKFLIDRHGKPAIDAEQNGRDIRFNLSHSSDKAIIAVAFGHEVGVDIEGVKAGGASLAVAERYFSARELASLRDVPDADRDLAFFTCWTRKEAYLKGRGEGLFVDLSGFDVSVVPREPAALLASRIEPADVDCWKLFPVPTAMGYVATGAVQLTASSGQPLK